MNSNKKPFTLKAMAFLLFLYATINIVTNLIDIFYLDRSGGDFFGLYLSFGPILDVLFEMLGLIIIFIPQVFIIIAGVLIWKRKRVGYWITIVLLILSFIGLYGAIEYLWENLPILFSEDLLFLRTDTSGMTFIFNYGDFNTASTQSLMLSRFLTIKSFVKAFIEIFSFGFLLFISVNPKSYFKK